MGGTSKTLSFSEYTSVLVVLLCFSSGVSSQGGRAAEQAGCRGLGPGSPLGRVLPWHPLLRG